jgi:hypothetical protein
LPLAKKQPVEVFISDIAVDQQIDHIIATYSLALDGHFDTTMPRLIKDLSIFQQQQVRHSLHMPVRLALKHDTPTKQLPVLMGSCPGCGAGIMGEVDHQNKVIHYLKSLHYNGERSINRHEPCRHPQPSPYHSPLFLPSGKLVVANDLRDIIEPNQELRRLRERAFQLAQRGTINPSTGDSRDGERLHHEFWRQQGLYFIPASNTSVTVAQDPESQKLLFSLMSPVHPDHTPLGNIITDLWAVTLMDRQMFDDYCIAQGHDPEECITRHDAITLSVPAGEYQGTLLFDMLNDPGEPNLVATLSPTPR